MRIFLNSLFDILKTDMYCTRTQQLQIILDSNNNNKIFKIDKIYNLINTSIDNKHPTLFTFALFFQNLNYY